MDIKKITSVDYPYERKLGWCCERCLTRCLLSIVSLKNDVDNGNIPEHYKFYLKTSDGRKKLAHRMSDGWIPDEWVA